MATNNMDDLLPLEELKRIMQSLRNTMRCVVCTHVLERDTLTCVNGHCICKKCRGDQATCPTCKKGFSNVEQNNLVRQVLDIIPKRCRRDKCPSLVHFGDDHETYCPYRLTPCRFCSKNVVVNQLKEHCESSHPLREWREVKEKGIRIITFDSTKQTSQVKINLQYSLGHFFWEVLDMNLTAGVFKFKFFPVWCGKPEEELSVQISVAKYKVSQKIGVSNADETKGCCLLVDVSAIQWREFPSVTRSFGSNYRSFVYGFTIAQDSPSTETTPAHESLTSSGEEMTDITLDVLSSSGVEAVPTSQDSQNSSDQDHNLLMMV